MHRRPQRLLGAAMLASALLGAGACGAGPTPEQAGSTAVPSNPTAVAGDQLTVVVDDGGGVVTTWTLLCEEGPDGAVALGGDHPDVTGACAAVTERAAAFAPVPKDRICTMIYGGPQTARVTGTWAGAEVDSSFRRTNGCEIARWNRMAALLQPGVPVSSGSGAV